MAEAKASNLIVVLNSKRIIKAPLLSRLVTFIVVGVVMTVLVLLGASYEWLSASAPP